MRASHESASVERPAPDATEAVLVSGVNWLGDSIMSMPAIQAYREAHPHARISMLVKPKLAPIWRLHDAITDMYELPDSVFGMAELARRIGAQQYRRAFILPHSFRSAIVPFLARIPDRIGMPGHGRDWMLTRTKHPHLPPEHSHQSHEYLQLLGLSHASVPPPHLSIPEDAAAKTAALLGVTNKPCVGLMPGAAHGPSKQWPADYFIEAGRRLKDKLKCTMVLLGSSSETELIAAIAQELGPDTVNLAGKTSLETLAAVLSRCAMVIGNDSGGMHLAAAVGAPTVVIFGITDPDKTAPIGPQVRILQDSRLKSRDIPRKSAEAEESLRRITPDRVVAAVCEMTVF